MLQNQGSRPALRLVQGAAAHPVEWSWFCGHCAAPSPRGEAPPPVSRVCTSCGLGLLLETRRDVLPASKDPFLVIDSSLLVQAVSRRAQTLLAVTEEDAVNHPVVDLLQPADAEAGTQSGFAAALVSAAAGTDEPASAVVRPWNTFGVRMRARIAPCGPPRAALVVLEDPAARRLRAVN
jgi:PAS domain-containing protein